MPNPNLLPVPVRNQVKFPAPFLNEIGIKAEFRVLHSVLFLEEPSEKEEAALVFHHGNPGRGLSQILAYRKSSVAPDHGHFMLP